MPTDVAVGRAKVVDVLLGDLDPVADHVGEQRRQPRASGEHECSRAVSSPVCGQHVDEPIALDVARSSPRRLELPALDDDTPGDSLDPRSSEEETGRA